MTDRFQRLLWDNHYVDPDKHAEISILLDDRSTTTDLAGLIKLADLIKSVHMAG